MTTYRISQLAAEAGVPIDTVRYYERNGLIAEPPRRPSGYREYPPETIKRLRFIRRAKELGFTLEEVGELLDLGSRPAGDMAGLKHAAREKLAVVDAKIAELKRVQKGLRKLIEACPGHGALRECPILSALSGEA